VHRISTTSVADVYPHDVAKAERKGRSKAELDQVIDELVDELAKGKPIEKVLRA
jgi:hypothetical protein